MFLSAVMRIRKEIMIWCDHVHPQRFGKFVQYLLLNLPQVGVKDLTIQGRLRTTFIPLLHAMPVVGAVQVGCPTSLYLQCTFSKSQHLSLNPSRPLTACCRMLLSTVLPSLSYRNQCTG